MLVHRLIGNSRICNSGNWHQQETRCALMRSRRTSYRRASMAISLNLPATAERVERHTAPAINQRIYREMRLRVAECYALSDEEIDARIRELEREWDIERTLEANAATVILTGLAL